MTTTTITASAIDDLTERAIRLAVEVDKLALAGSDTSVVLQKLDVARKAATDAGASFADIHRQADERLIEEIRNRWNPEHEGALAVDGDLDHPVNARGEVVDLTRAAA
jgi:hypothetical protein